MERKLVLTGQKSENIHADEKLGCDVTNYF